MMTYKNSLAIVPGPR